MKINNIIFIFLCSCFSNNVFAQSSLFMENVTYNKLHVQWGKVAINKNNIKCPQVSDSYNSYELYCFIVKLDDICKEYYKKYENSCKNYDNFKQNLRSNKEYKEAEFLYLNEDSIWQDRVDNRKVRIGYTVLITKKDKGNIQYINYIIGINVTKKNSQYNLENVEYAIEDMTDLYYDLYDENGENMDK
jgi:hypothetical protein